jgi:hypothetical protein
MLEFDIIGDAYLQGCSQPKKCLVDQSPVLRNDQSIKKKKKKDAMFCILIEHLLNNFHRAFIKQQRKNINT